VPVAAAGSDHERVRDRTLVAQVDVDDILGLVVVQAVEDELFESGGPLLGRQGLQVQARGYGNVAGFIARAVEVGQDGIGEGRVGRSGLRGERRVAIQLRCSKMTPLG
jgi:hypothetical protein